MLLIWLGRKEGRKKGRKEERKDKGKKKERERKEGQREEVPGPGTCTYTRTNLSSSPVFVLSGRRLVFIAKSECFIMGRGRFFWRSRAKSLT